MKRNNYYIIIAISIVVIFIGWLVLGNVSEETQNPANVSRDEASSFNPKVILDSDDIPHLTWYGGGRMSAFFSLGEYDIRYAKLNYGSWENYKSENYESRAYYISMFGDDCSDQTLIFDNENKQIICWTWTKGLHDEFICLIRWDGKKLTDISGNKFDRAKKNCILFEGLRPEIQKDLKGTIHLTWSKRIEDNSTKEMYARWDGESWKNIDGEILSNSAESADISEVVTSTSGAKILFDKNDTLHFVWKNGDYSNEKEDICLIKWVDGKWRTVSGEIYNPKTNNANISKSGARVWGYQARFDSSNNPHIFWLQKSKEDRNDYVYATYIKWDGKSWVNLDNTTYNPDKTEHIYQTKLTYMYSPTFDFQLDKNDNPRIIWDNHRDNNWDVYYSQWNGSNWVNASGEMDDWVGVYNCNVSNSDYDATNPSFALDSAGDPHITWENFIVKLPANVHDRNTDIFYVKWNGSTWVCADGSTYKPIKHKGR